MTKRFAWELLLFAVPVALLVIQASLCRNSTSATYDETFYLCCARRTAALGRLDPWLTLGGVAPLPTLVCYLYVAAGYPEQRLNPHQGQMDDPPLIFAARRLNTWLVGVPLLAVVYLWLRLRRGPTPALLAASTLACSPSIVAHASLATTDLLFCLTSLLTLAGFASYVRRPTNGRLVLAAVLLGVSYAAKYSALFLFPIALGVLGWTEWTKREAARRNAFYFAMTVCAFFYVAWCTTWGLHAFAFEPLPPGVRQLPIVQTLGLSEEGISLPSPIAGLLVQMQNNHSGHLAFLMGERRMTGWWYYYPCVLYFKSTPAELFLAFLVGSLGLAVSIRGKQVRGQSEDTPEGGPSRRGHSDQLLWIAALVAILGLAMSSTINLGQRYVLLVYPLMIMLAFDVAWDRLRPRLAVCGAMFCLAGQALSVLSISPHYLSYFSPLVGGAARSIRLLSDSNLDWGQDLPSLKKTLDEVGSTRPLLCYFGTADPNAYGVTAEKLNDLKLANLTHYDWLAVSVGWLQGVCKGPNFEGPHEQTDLAVSRLLDRSPDAQAGYSIFLYDLRNKEVREILTRSKQ